MAENLKKTDDAVADEKTYTLVDEEILKVGTHKGFPFTPEILKEIFDNFYKFKGTIKPTVKLGHSEGEIEKRSGFPAVGYITDLKLTPDGQTLKADIERVPAQVKDLIDKGAYAQKSAEIWVNYEDENGEKVGPLLTGLAVLGEELPEIKTLSDIQKLYMSDQTKVLYIELSSTNKKTKEAIIMEDVSKKQVGAAENGEGEQKQSGGAPAANDLVTGLEKSLAELSKAIEAGGVDAATLEKIAALLTPVLKKAAPASEVELKAAAEKKAADEKKLSAEGAAADPKYVELEAQVKKLAADLEAAKQREKDAEVAKINLSDSHYIEGLVKGGKLKPTQKEKLEKLFFSVNKTDMNIIHLSAKETVSIKEVIMGIIDELPAQIDLGVQTKDIYSTGEKPPEGKLITDMQKNNPAYFSAPAAAGADKK